MKLEKENNTLYMEGNLIKATYDHLQQGKGKISKDCYYQVAVKTAYDEKIANAILKQYYADAEPQYIPKWLQNKEGEDEVICNFKSMYDIRWFIPDENGNFKNHSYKQAVDHFGGVIPLGSKVTINVTCKDGALYIKAIRFDQIASVSVENYF